jgi:hypothetical protein
MLVATRDPMPQHGEHHAVQAPPRVQPPPKVARLMFVLQLAGSMLAIPVGLASAYSIYRTNFAPETTCQTLRNNIIAMIDKQIDASTRRILVRRDVEEFEKTCGSVDPDAEAAFKSLLASEAPPQLKPSAAALDSMPAPEWRKAEPAPKAVKETKAKEPKESKERETRTEARAEPHVEAHEASPDARWLDAVRSALTTHAAERAAAEQTVKPLAVPASMRSAPAAAAPVALPLATSAPIAAAPVLPAPSTVSGPSEAARIRSDDHPVPPGSIPDKASEPEPVTTGSFPKQTSWTDHIPFFGR